MKSWSEISADPNSPEVLTHRKSELAKARNLKLIADRVAYICDVVRAKDVLDIGVVEHFRNSSTVDTWLHKHVKTAAASCLGIDILASEVDSLRQRGFDVIVHDITKAPLDRQFEIIVVGDVIEHLNDASGLFIHAAQMLRPSGLLLLTTPNPRYVNAIVKNLFEGTPFTDSADHVAWFDASTLCELASRSGLVLRRYSGVKANSSRTFKSRLLSSLTPTLIRLGIRPELFAKTMIYEFTPQVRTR